MTDTQTSRDDDLKKIADLVKGIDFAMLTTVEEDGTLHSRPMATQQVEFDGDLWFFTYARSHKVAEAERDHRVNVSYAHPAKQHYVSLSGMARLVRDRAKMEELWNPALKAWFPKGVDEPDIALLNVQVDRAEYWDAPSSPLAHAIGFLKSVTTGQPHPVGEHDQVSL